MKVLLTRKLHDFAIRELKKRYEVEIHKGKFPMPKDLLISKIRDKDGLVCYPYDLIDADVIAAGKKLRAISTYSVGYDHIDVKAAQRRKIVIGYTPEVLTRATADLAMALLLALSRRITEGDYIIRKNRWKTIFGPDEFLGSDLHGKTIGIFGMGRIGQVFAKRTAGFEMKILYHNRKRVSTLLEKKLGARFVSMDELARRSDVVSIHAPYTPQTHEIVNLKLLKKMKKTALLINTSRGKLVNEKDLAYALRRKIIAGAGLDVFQKEPISSSHPFAKMKNVIITPHSGSATVETREDMAKIAVRNLILSLSGKKPIYEVKAQLNH